MMVPFGYQSENPFELTRRTEKQTWNHQLNLCYMYDFQVDPCPQCSTPVDPYEVTTDPFVVSTKFETHIKNVTQKICEDNLGKKRGKLFLNFFLCQKKCFVLVKFSISEN